MEAKELGQQPINAIGPGGVFGFGYAGLTKREHFAAMAMQGYISRGHTNDPGFFVEYAMKCADALLAELAKEDE